jgi:hypothetical protein
MGSNQSCTVIRQGDWEHHLCWTETPKTLATENLSTKSAVDNEPNMSTKSVVVTFSNLLEESVIAESREIEISSTPCRVDSRHNSQRLK